MTRKKRVLFVTESHKLASGFGTYAKEVLPRLFDSGKYELAQMACYGAPEAFNDTKWLTYGVAPMAHETDYAQQHKGNPIIQWGITKFEQICLDFKPDIVITYRDPWMDAYIADSSFLPFFHWVWMPTIDSEPQKNEWLYNFNRCDGLMAYSEYGVRTIAEQTNGRIVPHGCAPPAIDPELFNIIPNKRKHKESLGLPADSFIVGTVMRNQKRKMFPELMKSFNEFVRTSPKEIANKALLYLHTSHPEKSGWDITELIHEYGLGSKVVVTYICRSCKKFFCSHYRDAITVCNHCGNHGATLPGVSNGIEHKDLVNIYNLMDLYVQYAICEGFGMPQVEAAACGVPIASIDYSAMEDVVKYTKGYPIPAILERELETNADRSRSNNESLVKILKSCSKKTEANRKKQRFEVRQACIEKYTWDNAAKAWEEYLDQVELKDREGQWHSPPTMNPIPTAIPQGYSNQQFCEWVCIHLLQDQYHVFNYKMLKMLRDLNFGASWGANRLDPCNPDTVFNENKSLADRRYLFDTLRVGSRKQNPQQFILEAHKRKLK